MNQHRLPSVIAIPLEEYFREEHSVLRLHRLCDAVEGLTKFFTIVALGELRRQLKKQPLPESLLKVLQPQIERPTFGQWLAMLLALTEEVAWELAVCGVAFPQFVKGQLESGLWGPEGLVRFRNDLVHGGGMPKAWAREQLIRWDPWLTKLLPHLAFLEEVQVSYLRQGMATRLVGPTLVGEEMAFSPDFAQKLQPLDEHVVLLRGDGYLDLWPLYDYGRASLTTLEGPREADSESPLVFFRAERKRCLYAALGSDLPHGERVDVLEEFLDLFQLRERRPAARQALDFEEELRHDAASLIGRKEEVKQAKEILRQAQRGIFWLSGPGGIGKSFLMARLAEDMRLPASQGCILAWRFKLSDEARGNRAAFLGHVVTKLSRWLKKEEQIPAADPVKLFNQVRELVDEVGKLTPEKAGGRASRVLIFVDGLDEIARLDESFLELPFLLSRENVVWVCAGRPEGQLPQVFSKARCTHLFPEGLPAMTDKDIRALLLESTLSRKYDLLALDQESGKKVTNPALEAVVQRAQGLPLYVHYVIQDILSGHYRFADLPQRLPPSLSDYYDDLLKRLSIGDLQALLTPLVVTLAWAHAPLDEAMLHFLMVRRRVLTEDEESRELLRQGLETIASMIRLAPLPGEQGFGYEPYHPTFREHLREDQAGKLKNQNRLAREEFTALARGWAEVPVDHPACVYALAYGPKILMEAERWGDLERLLTDLKFIEAKCAAGMTYDLVSDYNLVLQSLPEAQQEIKKERDHQARIETYVDDMIAYARAWNEARDRHAQNPVKYAMPTSKDIPLPKVIPSVKPWSEKKIKSETMRNIKNPNRLDRIRAFARFVKTESHALVKFASYPGFCLQQAWNTAIDGPVTKAAEALVREELNHMLLLHHSEQRPPYEPHPALLQTLEGHTDYVNGIAITPDGHRALSGSGDCTLRLWDLETGVCLMTLEGHTDYVNGIAITPDGRRALSGSGDCTLRLWDLETGVCLMTLAGHSDYVDGVAITPDGRLALSLGADSTLRMWDLETGDCLTTYERVSFGANVARTPNCKLTLITGFVGAGFFGTYKLCDLDPSVWIRDLEVYLREIHSDTLTLDNRRTIFSFEGIKNNNLILWDLFTGNCVRTLKGHTDSVESKALTPDGCRVLSGSSDKTIRLWDLDSGACLRNIEAYTRLFSVALTPDSRRAISGGEDFTLRLWDLERGSFHNISDELRKHVDHLGMGARKVLANPSRWQRDYIDEIWSIAIAPDSRWALSGSSNGYVWYWILEKGAFLAYFRGFGYHSEGVKCLALTPDGCRALSGGYDSILQLWDPQNLGACDLKNFKGHTDWVDSLAITPDGRLALSGSGDCTMRLWDLETGACLMTLAGHSDYVDGVAITPDGRRALSGSGDCTLRLWDLETGTCLKTIEGHTDWVDSLAITPDGRRALSGTRDGTLRLWDLQMCACLKNFKGHTNLVESIAITPDGRLALSGSEDCTLRLWELDEGACIACYQSRGRFSFSSIKADGLFVLGKSTGEVICLHPLNFPLQPPLVTPVRFWLWGNYRDNSPNHWDQSITISCLWCGQRFPVMEHILDVIRAINRESGIGPDDSPCLSLPDEAWEEPLLLSACPLCKKPLKFNPFIVDNRDRY